MDVSIIRKGTIIRSIPFSELVAFRLLCDQYGIHSTWDRSTNQLILDEEHHTELYITSSKQSSYADLEDDLIQHVSTFLASSHIPVQSSWPSPDSHHPEQVHLHLSIEHTTTSEYPHLEIISSPESQTPFLTYLLNELDKTAISTAVLQKKMEPHKKSIGIMIFLPDQKEKHTDSITQLAMIVATAILRGIQQKHPMAMLRSLSPTLPLIDAGEPEKPCESNKSLSPSLSPNEVEEPSLISPQPIQPIQRSIRKTDAEIYFDYSILPPVEEEEGYMIMGQIIIKNTGTTPLYDPILCLTGKPVQQVTLAGPIIPPTMIQTLSVMTDSGAKGWKYIHTDWMRRSKTSGEFWIRPIHQVIIEPNQLIQQPFQLSLQPQPAGKNVTVTGTVYFEQQELTKMMNNRISVSF